MQIFDAATEQIKQGGRRRGANMGILDATHPDVEPFVTAKEGTDAFRNFNLSVATDATFWEAHDEGEPYDLVNPRTDEVVGQADPDDVLDLIAETAWETGDPGLLFSRRSTSTIRRLTSVVSRRRILVERFHCVPTRPAFSARSTSPATLTAARSTGRNSARPLASASDFWTTRSSSPSSRSPRSRSGWPRPARWDSV